eukprot:8115086-Pyramimonas_sp.AAC.1
MRTKPGANINYPGEMNGETARAEFKAWSKEKDGTTTTGVALNAGGRQRLQMNHKGHDAATAKKWVVQAAQ